VQLVLAGRQIASSGTLLVASLLLFAENQRTDIVFRLEGHFMLKTYEYEYARQEIRGRKEKTRVLKDLTLHCMLLSL
jgi:hypothetical protein